MARYGVTFMLAVVTVGLTFMANLVPPEGGPAQEIGTIDWSVIAVSCVFACMSLWGLIGIALSKLKEQAQKLAMQEVTILDTSWHFGLNTWANFNQKPLHVRSECEYWARLFHGLLHCTGLVIALYIMYTVILIVGWLFSACPRPKTLNDVDKVKLFGKGHQWIGPIVLALALSATAVLTDSPTTAVSLVTFPNWEKVGLIAGLVVVAIALLAVAIVAGIWVVWPLLRSLGRNVQAPLSFPLVWFIAHTCRRVRFVAVT